MPGVFISYRREDSSGYTGRLFDIVSSHFGRQNTFMDLDAIQGGDDFAAVIEKKISISDVLLAVIGAHWLTIADEQGERRLNNPRDFVRLEIGKALKRGIRVIPVLVGGAVMPRAEDLPDDLLALCQRQAVEVRDAHFHSDAEELIAVLHKALHGVRFRVSNLNGKRFVPAVAFSIGIAIVFGVLLHQHPFSAARHGPGSGIEVSGTKGAGTPDNGVLTRDKQGDRVQPENRLADVSGKWNATVKYDWGDSYPEIFELEVYGKDLSGSASFLGLGRGILDGKIEGNEISFMTRSFSTIGSDEKTYEDKHLYKGIVENNEIRFTMLTDSSTESHVPIHFTASRIKTH